MQPGPCRKRKKETKDPMSPEKVKQHEPTAVKREMREWPKERQAQHRQDRNTSRVLLEQTSKPNLFFYNRSRNNKFADVPKESLVEPEDKGPDKTEVRKS